MRKLQTLLLLIAILNHNLCFANTTSKTETTQIQSQTAYVKLSRKDYEELREQSLSITGALQKLAELEELYQQIKEIIISIHATVLFIKKTFNIPDTPLVEDDFGEAEEFRHISGTTMNPGRVGFTAEVENPRSNFKDQGIKVLEMDIYYNKKLFILDHLASKQLDVTKLKKIPLPQSQGSAKDRIQVPISDTLHNKLSFMVYLAPISSKKIVIGDSSKIRVVNYKRKTSKNPMGASQVIFDLENIKDDEIRVTAKAN